MRTTRDGGQEWTVDGDFVRIGDSEQACLCVNTYQAKAMCDAHNAALAAERDEYTTSIAEHSMRLNELREQLAAEREEVRIMTNQCVQLRQEADHNADVADSIGRASRQVEEQLREQLAAERER